MVIAKKVAYLFSPDQERDIREQLQQMVLNVSYNTAASYIPSSVEYPDGLISFVDRHMRYLSANPRLDVRMYLANVRLKIRINSKQ